MDEVSKPAESALQLALICRDLDSYRDILRSEPIAVVGMSCRFPGGAVDPRSYWELIESGSVAVSPIPDGRRGANLGEGADALFPPYGGYLQDVAGFDAEFFSLSPRELKGMDPQQRLLLELAWETLEDAQQVPARMYGSDTGVFIGMSSADYTAEHRRNRTLNELDAHYGTGCAPSVAAGRLSYQFGWIGPAMAVDTSCSSSLVSVCLATQALRARQCRLALAGGVNIMLAPETSVAFAKAGMLSPGGRCKTFAADADGYVRGEGGGLVLLATLNYAIANGLRIRALIRGGDTNQDGPSGGLTVPNGPAQERVMTAALHAARLRPDAVQYVEAHGTGTPLGDPIELLALQNVYGAERPLWVGSVKTLIGHLESAAGIAGLIKTVLALEHRRIPAHIVSGPLTSKVPWDNLSIRVPRAPLNWSVSASGAARVAAVSSFGFSGTNAHVVLEESPALPAFARTVTVVPAILPLSARSPQALDALLDRYRQHVGALEDSRLEDLLRAAQCGRSHFRHRIAINATSMGGLRTELARHHSPGPATGARGVAFLFTGQAAQYPGMGADAYRMSPVFRDALDRCNQTLTEWGAGILPALFADRGDSGAPSPFQRAAFAQPALTALQIALVDLWAEWGVRPAAVLGHSLGEVAAAYAAGVLGRTDALRLALERGRAMDTFGLPGGMLVVAASGEAVEASLRESGLEAEIAVVNGDRNVVVACELQLIPETRALLQQRGFAVRALNVTHAFHSRCVEPIVGPLQEPLASLQFQPPAIPYISSMLGERTLACDRSAYWLEQVRRPVRFYQALSALAAIGKVGATLELGPHPVLSHLARQHPSGSSWVCVEGLIEGKSDWSSLAAGLGALYVHGADISWDAVNGRCGARPIELPLYPFQRQRFWIEPSQSRVAEPAAVAAVKSQTLYEVTWREAPGQDTVSLPEPEALSSVVLEDISDVVHGAQLESFARTSAQLSASVPGHLLSALRKAGWQPVPQARWSAAELFATLALETGREPLFGWMLEVLAAEGWLARVDAGSYLVTEQMPREVIAPGTSNSNPVAEARLVERCAAGYTDVLLGRRDPLEVLAPGGDSALLASVYGDGPLARVMNRLVARLIGRGCRQGAARREWRVLEVGAGTGSTTRHVLHELAGLENWRYTVTDISPAFVARAREQLGSNGRLDFQTLNIDIDPGAQGFLPAMADVIVAANVLHATANVRRSVERLKDLLAPGGWIVILEGVEPVRWVDFVFGLTAGWWLFRDDPVRRRHPLLDTDSWGGLLADAGFEAFSALRPALAGISSMSQQAVLVARKPATRTPRTWIVLADRAGLGERLAQRLERSGDRCKLAVQGTPLLPTQRTYRTIAAGDESALVEFMRESFAHESARSAQVGVLSLWGLDATVEVTGGSGEALWDACAAIRAVARDISARFGRNAGATWITRRALVVESDEVPDPVQAAIAGLVRNLQSEFPALATRHLDLAGGPDEKWLDVLVSELLSSDTGEAEVALRSGRRWVPRLVNLEPAPPGDRQLRLRRDATYVVTGAGGALGVELCPWLAHAGAGHVVLAVRNPEKVSTEVLQKVRTGGARVTLVQLDVTDARAVGAVLARSNAPEAPLRGIFHLAGVLHTRSLADLDERDFLDSWNAKARAAGLLDRSSRLYALDHFVVFSSSAARLPLAGQALYAAANAALDAIVERRRLEGLPALCINWGPWQRSSFADPSLARAYEHYRTLGITPLDARAGLETLGRLAAADRSGVIVLDIDWNRLFRTLSSTTKALMLLEEMRRKTARRLDQSPQQSWSQLKTLPLPERIERLDSLVREALAEILESSPERISGEDSLTGLGVDSMMALELQVRLEKGLGLAIPVSVLLGRGTLRGVVTYLAEAVETDTGQTGGTPNRLQAQPERARVVEGIL